MKVGGRENPFELLGLPESFDLTAAQVAAAHMKAVAHVHPDRARDALERDAFVRHAAEAGQAKQKLMTEIGRAEALLALREKGLDSPRVPGGVLPAEFLAESLEWRERIEEAVGDAAALKALGQEIGAARDECVRELSELLRRTPDELGQAWNALARLRYYERMRVRVDELYSAPPTGQ